MNYNNLFTLVNKQLLVKYHNDNNGLWNYLTGLYNDTRKKKDIHITHTISKEQKKIR